MESSQNLARKVVVREKEEVQARVVEAQATWLGNEDEAWRDGDGDSVGEVVWEMR